MVQVKTVEIEGEECSLVEGRKCVVCEKADMAIRRQTRQGSSDTQHLECPRCGATAHRQVNVVSGVVIIDSDFQGISRS